MSAQPTQPSADEGEDGHSDVHTGWRDSDARPLAALFAARLHEAMIQTGITRAELAQAVDVGYNMVTHWLSGRRLPSLQRMVRIATALDAQMDYLLGVEVTHGIPTNIHLNARLVELAQRPAKTDEHYDELGDLHMRAARLAWERATRIRYPRQ